MKTKLFKTVPFFSTSKIKNQIFELIDMNILKYYNDNHTKIILSEIKQHIDDENICIDGLINIKYCDKDYSLSEYRNSDYSKILICIQSAKKGGMLLITNRITNHKRIIHPNPNCIIILNPLADYTVTQIVKGSLIFIAINIYIPSMKLIKMTVENIKYSNDISLLVPISNNEYMFVIKQIINANNKKIMCEQILINKEWFTLITDESNNKFYIPSICFGNSLLHFNYSYICFKKDIISDIINKHIPFEKVYPKKGIYKSIIIYEKIIYGKYIDN
ncbi:hypothetical protein DpV84gp137 [Deerpox virus W-1170-84]|uniref:Uncharacterized protein n=1 Tax=Deerpox virus (strain W-1170-84) TaxID=305676 RepID=Q08F45_DPV84|nr:hypothetical protein DpV84gp137 [Deerpox virus W-1170-84]AUI80698.1 hypothetical protein [White-tailed deer poxvirus]